MCETMFGHCSTSRQSAGRAMSKISEIRELNSLLHDRCSGSSLPRKSLVALLALGCLSTSLAIAAEQKETVIELSYRTTQDGVRPYQFTGHVGTWNITLRLLPGNIIHQTTTYITPTSFTRSYQDFHAVLGQPGAVSNSRAGIWHVMPNNVLLFGNEFPQSLRTREIRLLADGTCVFTVKDELKPGFNEFILYMAKTDEIEYFTKFDNSDFTCKIYQK